MAFALLVFGGGAARAETSDGLYGRMDGDLHIELDAGPAFDKRGIWGALVGHAHYLDTAGIYAAYEDALGATRDYARALSFGVSIRPLFLPRWGTDLQQGPATLDLAIDSLTFDLGALWPFSSRSPDGQPAPLRGPGFEVATSLSLPLFGRASGAWFGVRGALRYTAPEFASGTSSDQRVGPMAAITLGWREVLLVHWVDAGDVRVR
jgi:hypothetical protein